MTTIFEALQNANYNLQNARIQFQIEMAKEQLNNAVVLLEKGYDLTEEVDPFLAEYTDINDVPEKE